MSDRQSVIGHSLCQAFLVVAALVAASCSDPVAREICGNGIDDNGNLLADCQDPACEAEPACQAADGDGDGDGDADSDVDGDGDGDADVDGDGDADADADTPPCDPDTEVCVYVCERDEDCQLAYDMLDCCGGFPHDASGTTVACPTAVHRDRVAASGCVIPWSPGDPMPTVPETCAPRCEGITCGECPSLERAVCDPTGACVGFSSSGGCMRDGDCPDGSSCVDPDHDGVLQCVEGVHECATSADCAAAFPTCAMCDCMDTDADALRECACYGCEGGECFQDLDCELHYFCDDNACTFGGNNACRVPGGAVECEPCNICEPSESDPTRGHCVHDPSC